MAKSFIRVVASGNTSVFPVPFPYIDRTHIQVTVDGVPILTFNFLSAESLDLVQRPAQGSFVRISRHTPAEPIVGFTLGNLDPGDLNIATAQGLFRAQEASDLANDGAVRSALGDRLVVPGVKMGGLLPGVAPDDAVTLGQLQAYSENFEPAIARAVAAAERSEDGADRAEAVGAFIEESTEPWGLDLLAAYEAAWGGGTATQPGGQTPTDTFLDAYETAKE